MNSNAIKEMKAKEAREVKASFLACDMGMGLGVLYLLF
jgi:hypothetical protein